MRQIIKVSNDGRLEYSWPEDAEHMPRLLQDSTGQFWIREYGSEEWSPIVAVQCDFYRVSRSY